MNNGLYKHISHQVRVHQPHAEETEDMAQETMGPGKGGHEKLTNKGINKM